MFGSVWLWSAAVLPLEDRIDLELRDEVRRDLGLLSMPAENIIRSRQKVVGSVSEGTDFGHC